MPLADMAEHARREHDGTMDADCPTCVSYVALVGIDITPHTQRRCPCVTCESDR